jgi:hypothetical protein
LKEPGPNYYKPKYTLMDVVKNPPDIKSPQLYLLDDCKVRAKESAGYIYKPKFVSQQNNHITKKIIDRFLSDIDLC